MCTFCSVDPVNKLNGTHDAVAALPDAAVTPPIVRAEEDIDIPASTGTEASVSSGGVFESELEVTGDRDWISVTLEAGQRYEIRMDGIDRAGNGLPALEDPYLRLYDSGGAFRAENDDSGPGRNAKLLFTAQSSGTYYIGAGAWDDNYVGDYQITVELAAPPVMATLDRIAEYLFDDGDSTPHKFNMGSTGPNAKNGVITYTTGASSRDSNGISDARAVLVREAFDVYEALMGIDFQEVDDANADIQFGDSSGGAFASYGFSVRNGVGYVSTGYINIEPGWSSGSSARDSYTLQTIFHEIGHVMGLNHGGPYNGSGVTLDDRIFLNDSWQATMMSYFSQSRNGDVDASNASLVTPMTADLIALDNMYSEYGFGLANAFSGDTVWGFNTTISASTSEVLHNLSDYADRRAFTIIDAGGKDTVDFSGYGSDQIIDLTVTDGSMTEAVTSSIGFERGNMSIAEGTVIENAISGGGDDRLTGNGVANRLQGNGGDDTLLGKGGNDLLVGGLGADTLDGGDGFDFADYSDFDGALSIDLSGSGSSSSIFADDTLISIEGILGSATGPNTFVGDSARTFFTGGSAGDLLDGAGGSDILRGRGGDDTILGGAGNDALLGNGGADVMTGGADRDVFWFGFSDGFQDEITDFQIGDDLIGFQGDLVNGLSDLQITAITGGAQVAYGASSILLPGVSASALDADANFFFA